MPTDLIPHPGPANIDFAPGAGTVAPPSMETNAQPTIRYRVDSKNQLISVSDEWIAFAAENDGESVAPDLVLGKNLLAAISDLTLRQLYLQLVALARLGRPARFRFRCDSPGFRRLFEMTIRGQEGGVVEFSSVLLESESRPEVALFDFHQPRNESFLRVCSWCQRIAVGTSWLPVEEAVDRLGLMHQPTLPSLTHGICEKCNSEMLAAIAKLGRSGTAEPA